MVGHYFLTDYYSKSLFPKLFGWNPSFFGGFPQGQFYPSLFHWVAGGVGILIGSFWSFKLMVTIAIILTPIAFLYFLRKLNFSDTESAFSLLILTTIMISIDTSPIPGGDFTSTFLVGLVSQALSIPLLFFYLGVLIEGFRKNNFILSSILLTLLLLTHAFTAIVGVLAASIIFLVSVSSDRTRLSEYLSTAFFHAVLTFSLAAFWFLPFVAKGQLTSLVALPGGLAPIPPLVLVLLVFAIIITLLNRDNRIIIPLAISIPFVAAFIFKDFLLPFLPIQLYRFALYPLLFLAVPTGLALSAVYARVQYLFPLILTGDRVKVFFALLCLMIFVLYFPFTQLANPRGTISMSFSLPSVEGRVLTLPVYSPFIDTTTHIASHLTAFDGNEEINGLFIESTPNAYFIVHIKKEINEFSPIWGVVFEKLRTPENRRLLLPFHFKYFDINYVLLIWIRCNLFLHLILP